LSPASTAPTVTADDCVFCGIVAGEMPARTVHETDRTLAFLDVNPLARGHTLVVPRTHRARLADLDPADADALFGAATDLVPVVEAAVDADGVTVGVNDGTAAGQEVPHVHVHLVPRFDGDDGGPIHAALGSRPDLSEADLDDVAEAIRAAGDDDARDAA
jgi:histidine triad (HIT) family protein